MKRYILTLILFSVAITHLSAQDVLVVDGGSIHVMNNGVLTVKGGVINQNAGTIDNYGDIAVSGDWTNNATNTMLVNNSPGTVTLDGNNQIIKGTSVTDFYNLKLEGGGTTVKSLDINANVSNELDLGDEELQTNANTMYVNNPAVGAVVWNTGFVNSNSLGGYLARATNSTDTYTFPVGASSLSNTYRPVFITPNAANANVYGVRLADVNPDVDNSGTSNSGATGPFPVANKEAQVRSINTDYYFNISRLSGTDAADVQVDFFYSDGAYQTLAQWDGSTSEWKDIDVDYTQSTTGAILNSPDVSLTKNTLNNYNHDVFALAEIEFEIEVPGGLSPNADGFNDFFYIENLEYFPENELVVFNRWGDVVYEASPYQNDWNGQVNGSMILTGDKVSDGTYFYILKLSPDDENEPFKGSLELRRK